MMSIYDEHLAWICLCVGVVCLWVYICIHLPGSHIITRLRGYLRNMCACSVRRQTSKNGISKVIRSHGWLPHLFALGKAIGGGKE